MSTQDTQRLYLALDEGAFVEETSRLVLRAAFAVDEDFCESYGFGKVPALAGEELEVAEHVAMQQAAYVNVRAATSPSRCLVAVAQAVSLPVSPRDTVICEVGPELPGQRILTEPLEWEQLVSFHVDEPGAIQRWSSLAHGSEAAFADYLEDPLELLWFDPSELELLRQCLRD